MQFDGLQCGKNPALLDKFLNQSQLNQLQLLSQKNMLKLQIVQSPSHLHGTTVLALKCKRGVIIAGDKRVTIGSHAIFSDECEKVYETGSISCLAAAGSLSDIQLLVEILNNNLLPRLESFLDTEIFIDGQANLLKNLMRQVLFFAWPILAGWDPNQKTGRIFLYEPGGAFLEADNYAAYGSGGNEAEQTLKSNWFKDLSCEDGIQLAIKAMLNASDKDSATSPHPPSIKVISSRKITTISRKIVRRIAEKIDAEKQSRLGKTD